MIPFKIMCFCAIASVAVPALSQTTVDVYSGEALTELDLLNGEFMGQAFELAPETIFQIHTGGLIGPVGSSTEVSPFNFGGSMVNLETGSNFSPVFEPVESFLSNITMNAFDNSRIWNTSFVGPNAQLNVHGGFYAGKIYDGATINITSGILISGTKAFGGSTINATGGVLQSIGIRDGSTLNSSNAEITTGFRVIGGSSATLVNTTVGILAWVQTSSLDMRSGTIGDDLFLQGAHTTLEDVTVGNDAEMRGGNLTLINSAIGDNFYMNFQTNVEMFGGSIGDHAVVSASFGFNDAGTLTVHGGAFGHNLTLGNGADLNIYGGTFENIRSASFGTEINLFVTAVSLNGVDLDILMFETLEISDRDGALLEATLSDGSFFDLVLNQSAPNFQDSIGSGTSVTVTLVPAPSALYMLCPLGILANRRPRR